MAIENFVAEYKEKCINKDKKNKPVKEIISALISKLENLHQTYS